MASHERVLPCPDSVFQSPAKVFARLKSKVQSEEQMACGVHTFISPRKNLMESTAVFPLRTRTDPRSTTESNGHCGTPLKTTLYVASSEEELSPLGVSMSPVSKSSTVRMNLRKRKAEQEINKVCSRTVVTSESRSDNKGNTGVGLFTPRKARMEGCVVSLEKLNTPKVFAYMKQKVSRGVLEQDSHDFIETGESPDGVFYASDGCHSNVDKIDKNNALRCGPQILVTQDTLEFPNGESHPEKASLPAVESEHFLLEDPILLTSPSISIPRNNSVLMKKKWPNFPAVPATKTVSLEQWFLRRNRNGLFVEGIRIDNKTTWNSNIIIERHSSTVLKTITDSIYNLVGKMKLDVDSDLPPWFLRMFVNGFPANWKKLFKKCSSELKQKGKENTENRSKTAGTTTTKMSDLKTRKKTPEQNTVNTSEFKPETPTDNTFHLTGKVTRSGRMVKPPLEHWKGGRVFLDRDMNVVVFEGYNTSIFCSDESMDKSKGISRTFLLSDEGHTQHKPSRDGVQLAPLTKVQTPLRKHSQVHPDENPSILIKGKVKGQNRHNPSSKEKLSKDKPLPSSKPKNLPVERSKTKIRNAPPLKRSGRKQTPNHSYTDDDSFIESEEQQQEDETQTGEEMSHKNTTKSRHKPKKFPVPESKTEVFNATPFTRSRRKCTPPMGTGFYAEVSLSEGEERQYRRTIVSDEQSDFENTLEQEEARKVPNTKWKKRGKRRPVKQSRESQCENIKPLSHTKTSKKSTHLKKKLGRGHDLSLDSEEDEWTRDEQEKLQQALKRYPPHVPMYWQKVAKMVGTRSAEECHNKDLSNKDMSFQDITPVKTMQEKQKKKTGAQKAKDIPLISAGIKTFKRKQQVRQFLEEMPKENTSDAFSAPQSYRFKLPSTLSDEEDFSMGNPEPLTPLSQYFPQVKTPRGELAASTMYTPNRNEEDKYAFKLRKMVNQNQVNGRKQNRKHTPSVKPTMKPLKNQANDSFIVWEMFPEKPAVLSDSSEDEDYYFSDDD
ncbi:mis18-binding protein 1 [Corythoichthys intestinalis]|uniref:mis18-binding protein 1 n=1 Tax=Corythoichthys intestinalis TaxID=161448 RepID=UPI0025A54ACB|nr:mis18-binding protein 1 [Corythoichthys intestinalis]